MELKLPPVVTLAEEHVKRFAQIIAQQKEIATRQVAVRQFLSTVVQTGEARLAELQEGVNVVGADLKKLWEDVARSHSLDLDRHQYDLADDGKSLFVKSIKVVP